MPWKSMQSIASRTTRQKQLKKRLQERNIRHSTQVQHTKYRGFLDLPAEIKNIIYDMWTEDEPIYMRPTGADFLTTTHPVASLCRQTRDEFTSIVTLDSTFAAPTIIAQVHDFNLYYVDQFMKLVADDERAEPWDFTYDGGRVLAIEFTLTEAFCRDPPVEKLAGWFRWMNSFEQAPLIEYSFREVAKPEKALKIFERFATGHARNPFLKDMVGLFREFVDSGKEVEDTRDDDDMVERRRLDFLESLMEEDEMASYD